MRKANERACILFPELIGYINKNGAVCKTAPP